ncbi:MAG: N(4)-(beta-N-acetylglucosaminyl)-L-asparaginase [Candidatus Aminicenantes bacterium]|nr:N(4)-(beta-N-acetylglucosaminyl)-L-asparaginase [Candidatus Aminicenantes bacterium]
MTSHLDRRAFLKTGAAWGAALAARPAGVLGSARGSRPAGTFKVVASGNGLRATEKAMALLKAGEDPLDAVIAGVNIVENDPNDMSVGYGGLPNEEGVVELDASVMHGPTHASGAVAALQHIMNPSQVAKLVMERTNHCLIVGEGALKFALAYGFVKENLLTDRAREVWLRWRENLSDRDNWLPPGSKNLPPELQAYVMTYGTINCLALDDKGDLAGVTTTSGLSWKRPGRVGDSPIIGAGLYVDNDIGAAGSTGFGEANIMNLASFQIVQFMGQGMSPEQACLKALERVADKAKRHPRLTGPDGRPNFGMSYYALNKKGEFGSASMTGPSKYAAHDGAANAAREAAYLFKAKG